MILSPDFVAGLQDTLALDLRRFAPECVLVVTIVAMLVLRLFTAMNRFHMGAVALGGTMAGLMAWMAPMLGLWEASDAGDAFTGLLALDPLAGFLRGLLLGFAVLVVILTRLTGIPDTDDSADFYTMLLGATLGMMVMVAANHLLMVFLGVEMASLPSYALAGFLKGRKSGSEAALKYVIYGAASSGVMLHGISLLVVAFGTGSLPAVAAGYANVFSGAGSASLVAVATLFFLVGLGFKLGAVPFHFWLPDVFEGAAAEVAAFLSIASKVAAIGLTARFLLTLQNRVSDTASSLVLPESVGIALLLIATMTMTLGNVLALMQTNVKRLLAYSTIAHAGYMLLGLATLRKSGVAAVLVYLVAYLLMNLGAFATVAFVRNRTGSESLDAYRGLLKRAPTLTIAFAVCLISLLGLPPFAGFVGKFQVFVEVFDAGRFYANAGSPNLAVAFYALLGIAVVNTVVSAGYYLKILRIAIFDEPLHHDETGHPTPLGETPDQTGYLALLAMLILIMGVWWGPLTDIARTCVG